MIEVKQVDQVNQDHQDNKDLPAQRGRVDDLVSVVPPAQLARRVRGDRMDDRGREANLDLRDLKVR